MKKSEGLKTLDEKTFKWIEDQKTLDGPGRPPEPDRRRQRYFHIRSVARKEIADLTKLAEKLPQDQLDQIFNMDNLEGLLRELLWAPVIMRPDPENREGQGVPVRDPDLETAMIAQRLIEFGFGYLSNIKRNQVTLSHRRTIEEAIDLSHFLLDSFRPESERGRVIGN